MDSLDNFRERFEALEQQTEQLKHHSHTIERRLRLWRGMACGVLLLGLVSLPLSSETAEDDNAGLARRVKALEYKLQHVTGGPDDVTITGANLRIVNGLGATDTTNGLGNLIVGYNELRGDGTDNRTGSHSVVVGRFHNFLSFGGVVVGDVNEISGPFASVSGGRSNTASGSNSSVSGGNANTASGFACSVSGGQNNTASGFACSVSGGFGNTANNQSSIGGGIGNTASGSNSSVSGGENNTASGSGSSVSGGENNTASGSFSSVSGGTNRSAPGTENWAAGPLFADN